MPTVTSADGTTIAYERTGSGPALVLVDGAMCYRGAGPMRPLAALLQDTSPSTPTTVAAGAKARTPCLRGRPRGRGPAGPHRAGRRRGIRLRHLLRCGARPGDRGSRPRDHQAGALRAAVHGRGRRRRPDQGVHRTAPRAARRRARGDAVALFMTNVGMPAQAVAGMRAPAGLGHAGGDRPDARLRRRGARRRQRAARRWRRRSPFRRWSSAGGASPHGLQQAAKATADALPTAEHRTLDGQTHDVAPEALAPVLVEFFGA